MKKVKVSASAELEYVRDLKRSRPWYSNSKVSVWSLIILGLIDTAGFIQGMIKAIPNIEDYNFESDAFILTNGFTIVVMILAFIVAFEVATIYMGYAFSLKLYGYDRFSIRYSKRSYKNYVLSKLISTSFLGWISFAAFGLGVVANIIFRLGLLKNTEIADGSSFELEVAITIVMIILPIITSIVNFVISCFTFDPILFELSHISKTLGKLNIDLSELEAKKEAIQKQIDSIALIKSTHENIFISKSTYAQSLRYPLRTRIYEEQMKGA